MKLIRKITPVLILLVIAFAHVAEASKVSRSLVRRNRNRQPQPASDSAADLNDTSALALWQAFKKAGKLDYVSLFFGFLGAYNPKISGTWMAVTKSSAFVPFLTDVTTVCMSSQLVDDSTPISDPQAIKLQGVAGTYFAKIESSSKDENCTQLKGECGADKPATTGLTLLFSKIMSAFEGFKAFHKCFLNQYQKNKASLAEKGTALYNGLKDFFTLFGTTSAIKKVLIILTGGVSLIATLLINLLRFCVTLYRAIKGWKATGKINFIGVGTLIGLLVKTVTDASGVSRRRKFRKYKLY